MASPVTGIAPMAPQPMSTPSFASVAVGGDGANTSPMELDQQQPIQLPIDIRKLRALGAKLASDFKNYEAYRRLQELRWARNLRQFLGEYDPDVIKSMDDNRSRAYPRVTRVKCISMLSRLMNLLFPTSEKNWGIAPAPVPNLNEEDLSQVIQNVTQQAQQNGQPVTSDMIEDAVWEFAVGRAKNLEREIADQLAEIGGNRNLDYVALCRRVLLSGILYGAGVLKGPATRLQEQRTWVQNATGQWVAQTTEAFRPHFEFVPIWDYYPDMAAKHLHQMDGQFERKVMSKSQLRELADRPDFFGGTILKVLEEMPQGNYTEKSYESELRVIGVHTNVNPRSGNKFEVLIWSGFVASDYMQAAGIELPAGTNDMVEANVWMIGNEIIRADLSPWVEIEPDQRVATYHHFLFEEDDSSLLGNGLPNIIRDSQMGVAAAARMLMDNASIVCGPNIEINMDLLQAGQDFKSIQPYKVWYREGTGQEAQWQAVRNVDIESHIDELSSVVKLFMDFADAETFINPATGGDMQKGPSEPFRTAAGASMLQGQAALPFKDVVRNFDSFTMSVVNSLILFNRHFNAKTSVRGDFTPIARGSSSLIAKEVRGIAYDNLANTLQEEERPYINWYKLLQERLAVRDMDVNSVLVSESQAEAIDAANQQKQADQDADMKELLKAEIRKLLADATKSLTQSDSNSAKAEVATYNAILKGLESGVAPTDVHAARSGAGIPPAIARRIQLASGNGAQKAGGTASGNGKKSATTSTTG